jgi:hypothetical protein
MTWEKPSQKSYKIKCSRIAAAHGVGLAGLFSIIILILLIAPIASMGAPPQPPGRLVDDVTGSVGINMHIIRCRSWSRIHVLGSSPGGSFKSYKGLQL